MKVVWFFPPPSLFCWLRVVCSSVIKAASIRSVLHVRVLRWAVRFAVHVVLLDWDCGVGFNTREDPLLRLVFRFIVKRSDD